MTQYLPVDKPMTALDLLGSELTDILDPGRSMVGGGSGKGKPVQSGDFVLTASTQVEADGQIRQHLAAKGITVTSQNYSDEYKKIRTAAKVESLPTQ